MGRSTDEVRAEEPDQYQAWLNSTAYAPGGGESYDEASIRIEEALEKLVAEYPGMKVIVVTHNGVIKTAIKLAMGAPADAVFHVDATPCSISSISIWPSDGLRALRSFNERGHLR
jgi:ribonuclease H / adenosylcobalamin/alpha-ribazole phosphatase